MSDPGLTRRLRQQSHRSGLMVGISMALAIAVCLGAFTVLYVKLDPWVRDFSGSEPAPTATPRDTASTGSSSGNTDNQPADEDPTAKPKATETPVEQGGDGNVNEADATDTSDNGDFSADYQVSSLEAVNFRSGPGTSFDVIGQLDPGTELQYEDDSQAATEPENVGVNWLKFTTKDGEEGWIRDIDVSQT